MMYKYSDIKPENSTFLPSPYFLLQDLSLSLEKGDDVAGDDVVMVVNGTE